MSPSASPSTRPPHRSHGTPTLPRHEPLCSPSARPASPQTLPHLQVIAELTQENGLVPGQQVHDTLQEISQDWRERTDQDSVGRWLLSSHPLPPLAQVLRFLLLLQRGLELLGSGPGTALACWRSQGKSWPCFVPQFPLLYKEDKGAALLETDGWEALEKSQGSLSLQAAEPIVPSN